MPATAADERTGRIRPGAITKIEVTTGKPKRSRVKSPPAPRGTGRPRRDRRVFRRGGEGVGGALNQIVGEWPDVRITPMFGRWGYFVGDQLFGCYPIRAKEHDLWVRLAPRDQARALAAPGVRPHRRFETRGWIECDVTDSGELARALKWLRRGHAHVTLPGEEA